MKKGLLGCGGLIVVVIIIIVVIAAVAGSGDSGGHPRATATPRAVAASTAPAPLATTPAPPPPPQFTPQQQQVLDSAESYLTGGQGFSRKGLFDQLTSKYGEGFSRRLALFALAHLRVNWNRQAVISAKGYLNSGQGFSYNGLVQQLDSPYGEQFTPAQARYGARIALRG